MLGHRFLVPRCGCYVCRLSEAKGIYKDAHNCAYDRVYDQYSYQFGNAAGVDLFDTEKFGKEVQDLKTMKERETLSQASRLFLELFFTEHRLLQMLHCSQDPTPELKKLSELIETCANYPDISFDAQTTIVEIMGRVIDDNDEYEKLIDKISEISSQRKSEVEGALIHFIVHRP